MDISFLGFLLWSIFTTVLGGYLFSRFPFSNDDNKRAKDNNQTRNSNISSINSNLSQASYTSPLLATFQTQSNEVNIKQSGNDTEEEILALDSIPPQTELQTDDTKVFVRSLDASFELDKEEEEEVKLIQDAKSYDSISNSSPLLDFEISESTSVSTTTITTTTTTTTTATTPMMSTNLYKFIPNINYIEKSRNRKHHLDLYVPRTRKNDQLLDVVVHIHGGGWKRGDRSIGFYGAPSMCKFYASGGFLAVAPSYRLGQYPYHIEDIAKALEWVHKNIKTYGGNPLRIYLSGHSAGGNIAALLAVHSSTLLPDLPSNFIRGAVCVSGVYSLHQPLGGGAACTKNFIFLQRYVRPVFGTDSNILIQNSPTCLLQLRLSLPLHRALLPKKERKWSIWNKSTTTTSTSTTSTTSTTMTTTTTSTSSSPSSPSTVIASSPSSPSSPSSIIPQNLQPQQHRPLPPFLLLSAGWDMGLETDATNFYQLLQQAGSNVKYFTIPNTNHATICWAPKTEELSLNFIREHLVD